jgi:hypothetical protein
VSNIGKFSFFVFILVILFGNAAVAACNNSNGLVACYPFNGNANNSSSVSGLNGTVSGSQLTADRFGNPNSAYLFDGIDDFIEISNTNDALSLGSSFTIAAWVKPAATGIERRTNPIIWKISSDGSNRDNYLLSWANDSTFMAGLERSTEDRDFEIFSTTKQFSNWYHVAGIYNGQNLQIYVDGVLEKSIQIGAVTPYTGSAPLRIGNNLNSNHANAGVFNGVIDEVAIYNRSLTTIELLELAELPTTRRFPGVSLYNPSLSGFYLKEFLTSGNADHEIRFGTPNTGLMPLLGDWDGDLINTIGLYNPTRGVFHLKNTPTGGAADITFPYGPANNAGWIPLTGDWDGNSVNTIGLYNPTRGVFYLKNSLTGGAADITFPYGPANNAGWIPLTGDWDGDGVDTVSLYNPTLGLFYLKNNLVGGTADVVFRYGPAKTNWTPLGWSWIKN